jgi:hypothetical protein
MGMACDESRMLSGMCARWIVESSFPVVSKPEFILTGDRQMNLEQAIRDLHQASSERPEPNTASRIRASRQVLIGRGCEAFGTERSASLSLHDLLTTAMNTPATAGRKAFAVLLVHALAVEGLVASRQDRGQLDRDICAFVESALPTVLQRSGYPFGAETYERRRSLERLHTMIDELLQPLEPTFPPAIQGLYAG